MQGWLSRRSNVTVMRGDFSTFDMSARVMVVMDQIECDTPKSQKVINIPETTVVTF